MANKVELRLKEKQEKGVKQGQIYTRAGRVYIVSAMGGGMYSLTNLETGLNRSEVRNLHDLDEFIKRDREYVLINNAKIIIKEGE